MNVTISADIIGSSSLSAKGVVFLSQRLGEFLSKLPIINAGIWGRVVRGDGIECVLDSPHDLLRVVLLLKFMVKSLEIDWGSKRAKQLGVRMAVALGELRTVDREYGVIDGEAIYMSGRALSRMTDKNGESIVVKCADTKIELTLDAIFSLVDVIVSRITVKQSEVLVLKLLRKSDVEIAEMLKVSRPNISTHLQRSGWRALENTIKFFESTQWQEI